MSIVFKYFVLWCTNNLGISEFFCFKCTAGNSCRTDYVKTPMYSAGVGPEDLFDFLRDCPHMHLWCIFAWAEDLLLFKTNMGITSEALS